MDVAVLYPHMCVCVCLYACIRAECMCLAFYCDLLALSGMAETAACTCGVINGNWSLKRGY